MPIGASASTLVEFEASLHGVAESLVAPASSKLKHPKSATSSERFLEEESSFVNDRSRPKAVERASQPYIDKATAFIDAEALRLRALRDSLRGITAFESHAFISGILESDYLLWPFPDPERLVDLPQDFLNRLALELDYWILRFSR